MEEKKTTINDEIAIAFDDANIHEKTIFLMTDLNQMT